MKEKLERLSVLLAAVKSIDSDRLGARTELGKDFLLGNIFDEMELLIMQLSESKK